MQRFKIKHSRVSRKEIVPSRVRVPTFLFRLCNSSPIEPIPFLLLPVRSFRSFAPAFIPHTCNIVRGKKALNGQLMLLDRFAGYLGIHADAFSFRLPGARISNPRHGQRQE